MPRTCAAFGCSNSSMKAVCKEKNVSFHRFPLKKPEYKQWLIKLRRKNFVPTEYSQLCSEHFTDDCFTYQNFTNVRLLKPGAIPTLFTYAKTSKRKRTSYEFESKQNENADNLKKTPGRKRRKVLAKEITSDEVDSSSLKCLNNQKDSCCNLDEKDNSECVPAVNLKVEEPWEEESKFTSKPFEDNSQDYDELQIEIKDVRSVPSSFTAEVADENATGISEKSSHFERPLKIQKREEIFGTLVASELSGLSVNPELYLKTKRAILDILIQAHFELINCGS